MCSLSFLTTSKRCLSSLACGSRHAVAAALGEQGLEARRVSFLRIKETGDTELYSVNITADNLAEMLAANITADDPAEMNACGKSVLSQFCF